MNDTERQQVIADIRMMTYRLVMRAQECDDATRKRIQRRLVSLIRDTEPEGVDD